jgi:Fic family protein
MPYIPDFNVDEEILDLVSNVTALVNLLNKEDLPSTNIKLRRTNRIRSIHSSLAIEGNTLSLEKVTDIIDGKRVVGSPREIQEVKSANEAYGMIDNLDPYSVDDILIAHSKIAFGLIDDPGRFRECGVGVYKGNVLIHKAPEYEDVPQLIEDLVEWTEDSNLHPLIKSSIFHCRFEYIHPFEDGNGRMGRLWHSLILSKWEPIFTHLPIESWIKLNQREYYKVLSEADKGNVTVFVKFMLRVTEAAVDELADELSHVQKKK